MGHKAHMTRDMSDQITNSKLARVREQLADVEGADVCRCITNSRPFKIECDTSAGYKSQIYNAIHDVDCRVIGVGAMGDVVVIHVKENDSK